MNRVRICCPQYQHLSFCSVRSSHWAAPGIIFWYPRCLCTISLLCFIPDLKPNSFIRFDWTIVLNLRPDLSSFHCCFATSADSVYYSFVAWTPGTVAESCSRGDWLCDTESLHSLNWCIFCKGIIGLGALGFFPFMRFNSHSFVSSVTPSLPQRWIQRKLWALVSKCPSALIAGRFRQVCCRSKWIKKGLYFTKSLKLWIAFWLWGERYSSSMPLWRSSGVSLWY